MSGETPDKIDVEFKLSKNFVSAFADAATVSGPVGPNELFVVNFYMDVHGLRNFELHKLPEAENPTGTKYSISAAANSIIPYREGVARILMTRKDMESLVTTITKHLGLSQEEYRGARKPSDSPRLHRPRARRFGVRVIIKLY